MKPKRHRELVYIIAQKASVGLTSEAELAELDALVESAGASVAPERRATMADEDATLDWNEPNDMDKQRARNLAGAIVSGNQAHRDTHALARWALWLESALARRERSVASTGRSAEAAREGDSRD
jgi:hypothetical protein